MPRLNISRLYGAVVRNRPILVKAASFALVGVVNTLLDFGVFSFAHFYLELPIIVANTLSWAVAVSGSYVMNSTITFAAESGRKLRLTQYASFVASQVGGFLANTSTVLAASYFIPVLGAKVLAIAVTFIVNFSLSHFAVFRPQKVEPERFNPSNRSQA
jgi:putative flippase GtrA